MTPAVRSRSTSGDAAAVVMDIFAQPFNASIAVAIVGTSATYSVLYTLDDPALFDDAAAFLSSAIWFTHPTMGSQTTNQFANLAFPVRAVKLNVASITTAVVTMTVIQSGNGMV